MRYQKTCGAVVGFIFASAIASVPAGAFDCSQQTRLIRPFDLGVSGGNINSFIKIKRKLFCFDGTLGSMVQDQSANKFILSNNHVLADTNKAKPGQPIVQPGLADAACVQTVGDEVASFTRAVKIKFGGTNTVDAAIAAIVPEDVNPSILNIGLIQSTVVPATVGLAVQKMGRTTCLTNGTISAVGVKVKVKYPGRGKAMFVNQIVINGPLPPNNFGAPGDSGSLIVTTDTCPQAVGLLFAGSQDQSQTIANPISNVLTKLGVSMTGGCVPPPVVAPQAATPQAVDQAANATVAENSTVAENATVSKDLVDSSMAVRDRHESELMKIPGAVGTGIGVGDKPGQPAIEVYINKMTPEAKAAAPKDVEGVPVKLIENGGFVAY